MLPCTTLRPFFFPSPYFSSVAIIYLLAVAALQSIDSSSISTLNSKDSRKEYKEVE
jgi:hypothetical protein